MAATVRAPARAPDVRYRAFGLSFDIDPPIPSLSPCDPATAPDVVCRLQQVERTSETAAISVPWYESEWRDDATGAVGLAIYRHANDYVLRYSDGAEFTINESADRIIGRYPVDCDPADVACYVTGPVAGVLLRMRGVTALHASVVEIDGKAIAFVGDACSGKSTTAAQFARMGFRIVTEDIAALSIDGDWIAVHPGCMEVALRPDTVAFMYGSSDALPKFSETWDKRRFDLTALGALATTAVPLGGAYLLTNRARPTAPCTEPLSSGQAILELLANVYGNRLFHDRLRVQELDVIHRLVASVPVKVATTGGDGRFLERFCEVILEDVRSS